MLSFYQISGAPISGFPASANETPPPDPDIILPTFTGSLSETHTANSITINWDNTVSADNVAISGRQYRIGGGAYVAATSGEEISESHVFTGLAADTTYQINVRCVDSSGNVSTALSLSVTTSAVAPDGTYTYLRVNLISYGQLPQGNLTSLDWALFSQLKPSLFGAPVAKGALETTNPFGEIEIQLLASIVPAGEYMVVITNADATLTVAAKETVT